MSQQWRWILGMLYITAVAVIWIAASFVVQSVVDTGVSPFIITYICNSLFLVYIPIVEVSNLLKSFIAKSVSQITDQVPPVSDTVVDSETVSETVNLLPVAAGSEAHANDSDELAVDSEAGIDQAKFQKLSATELEIAETPAPQHKIWTRRKTACVSLIICPFWFLAQYTFNLSLKYTSVTSNTILSSASSLFTFLMSLKFLNEKFSWVKLVSILLCMAGTVVVSLSDSSEDTSVATNPAWGDMLCLVSGLFYAAYTTLIRLKLPDETEGNERASTALFLGFLGLFNGLLFLPIALIMHFTGFETFHRITLVQYGLIVGKGLLDNVLSDYLWAKAVLLTSTTAATAGLTIQVPIAAVVDVIRGIRLSVLEYIGGVLVLVGFFGINNVVSAGCCNLKVDDEADTPESREISHISI